MIGGKLIAAVGNKRNLRRFIFQHQLHKTFFQRITFNIQFRAHYLFQLSYIGIPDMSFVWPWVYGDPLGSKAFNIQRRFDQVRIIAPRLLRRVAILLIFTESLAVMLQ